MSIDLSHLFSAAYLFNLSPGPLQPIFLKLLLPGLGLMIILGLAAGKVASKNTLQPVKKFFNKLRHFLLTLGILGFIHVFFREQSVYLFSAPFWLLVWLLAALVWLGFLLKYYFTDRPERLEQIKQETNRRRYLKS